MRARRFLITPCIALVIAWTTDVPAQQAPTSQPARPDCSIAAADSIFLLAM